MKKRIESSNSIKEIPTVRFVAGESVDELRIIEEANAYIASKEVKQQNENL
ncbi:hypothetical protein [Cytobacillus purgationiresistens]|uniref:Glutaredoxin n=1 Tax=Cytobacillus purgationiresistens TaxID=863449 RepID=A0ABU0AB21_9BACI|nr:hypothetical protein [Cytobacillus purgationiresistens]MDQ0268448.1 hypothetical protein [Cytobacillus purgationiresistens]